VVDEPGPSSPAWRASRRAVLATGALAAFAGCSEKTLQPRAEALLGPLAAERALAASTAEGRALVRRVSERARARADLLAGAISAAGGRPHEAPAPAAGGGDPVARGRAALAAHIRALPSLQGREGRGLGADLVAGVAADVAVLGDVFGERAVDAFPGSGT
jgi:hypothetical protein